MKVICVDNKGGPGAKDLFPEIKIGEIVTVIGVKYDDTRNLHYRLAEYPFANDGAICYWWSDNFIPLSSIDETEFVRNYNKETV